MACSLFELCSVKSSLDDIPESLVDRVILAKFKNNVSLQIYELVLPLLTGKKANNSGFIDDVLILELYKISVALGIECDVKYSNYSFMLPTSELVSVKLIDGRLPRILYASQPDCSVKVTEEDVMSILSPVLSLHVIQLVMPLLLGHASENKMNMHYKMSPEFYHFVNNLPFINASTYAIDTPAGLSSAERDSFIMKSDEIKGHVSLNENVGVFPHTLMKYRDNFITSVYYQNTKQGKMTSDFNLFRILTQLIADTYETEVTLPIDRRRNLLVTNEGVRIMH